MWTRCFTKPATRADATNDAIRSLRKLFAESERAHAATICATTGRNGSQRTSASVRSAGHEMSADADGSSSARTPPAAGNRTPPCGPAGIGAHRRFADRMASQGTEGFLPAEIRLRPPIRGTEPQPAASYPSRRPAAHTQAKTA